MKALLQRLISKPAPNVMDVTSAWLSSLNSLDETSALKAVTAHLEKDLSRHPLSVPDRMNQLEMIDQYCHPMIAKLSFQFIKFQHLRADLETSISETTYAYYRQIYLWHLKLIETFATKENNVDYNTCRSLFGRAIEISFNMIRWRSYRQAPAPANIWLQLYTIYSIAARNNLLTAPIQLADAEAPTTIGALIIRTILLGSMDNSKMTRQQVDITSMLLKKWVTSIQISENYDPNKHPFYIDLSRDEGAKRTRNITPKNTYRYWEIDHFETKVNTAITAFEQQELLEELTPADFFNDYQSLIDTLHLLKTEWATTGYQRQRRTESRNALTLTATVCYGITETCNQVKLINTQNSYDHTNPAKDVGELDERLSRHTMQRTTILGATNTMLTRISGNRWSIVDESPKGIGALANKDQNLWAIPGKVVGLLPQNETTSVQVGVVRNIRPAEMNQVKIGVELLAKKASVIQMHQQVSQTETEVGISTAKGVGFSALFLPAEDGVCEYASLLIPKAEFNPNSNYEISSFKTKRIVHISRPIDARDDWVRVTYPNDI